MRKKIRMNKSVVCLIIGMMMACSGCAKSSMDIIAEQMEAGGGDSSENGSAVKDIYKELQKGVEETRKNNEKEEEKLGDKPVSFGQITDKVYTNKYLSMTCSLDDNWFYYSEEELQGMKSLVQGMMGGTVVGTAMNMYDYRMDMRAENIQDQTMVNIVYMKLGMEERKNYAKKTEKEIIDAGLAAVNTNADVYTHAGMNLKEVGAKTVTFLGKKRTAQYMVCDVGGKDYFTLQLFDYHTGEYATCVTVSSFVEDQTLELLNLFSSME